MFNRNEIPDDVLQSMEKLWPSYSTCEPLPDLSCIADPEGEEKEGSLHLFQPTQG